MREEDVYALCASLAGAEEAHPFGVYPICFRAGGRIFAQLYRDKVTLRCDEVLARMWRAQYEGVVVRGYHCPPNQAKTNNTMPYGGVPDDVLRQMIAHAHAFVCGRTKAGT